MMIHLKKLGASVDILNTGTVVHLVKAGLRVTDRCGCALLTRPIVLDNGVELSALGDELVLRHPYGLPVHVICTGKMLVHTKRLLIPTFGITLCGAQHSSVRGTNTLTAGDTFDVRVSDGQLSMFEVLEDGVKLTSKRGIHLELSNG